MTNTILNQSNIIQQTNWGEAPVAAAAATDSTLAKTHAVFIGQPPRIENQDACTLPLANCAILGEEVPEAIEAADEYAMSFGEVSEDGMKLKDVPEAFTNRIMVLTAVAQNGLALQFAPEKLRADPDIVAAALAQNPQAISHVNCTFLDHPDGKIVIKGVLSPQGINVDKQIKKVLSDNRATFGLPAGHRDSDYKYNGKSMLPSFLTW